VVTVQFQSEIGGQLFITLSTSLTAMPFTTSTYRKREREVGMLFPPIHQSHLYIWRKNKKTMAGSHLRPDIR